MKKTRKPIVAGILDIVAGIPWALSSLLLVFLYISCPPAADSPMGESLLHWLITMCCMVIGVLAIRGGIYALRRKKWVLALIGSICPALGALGMPVVVQPLWGPLLAYIVVGFGVPSIPAIIFTALSKDEFK